MNDSAGIVVLNFNVGVLGHVDSGKTSLAKSLSTVASTACFDNNPQSKERGITLDLGFSSFQLRLPGHLQRHASGDNDASLVQFTLVDCPGHASLIRTIIGATAPKSILVSERLSDKRVDSIVSGSSDTGFIMFNPACVVIAAIPTTLGAQIIDLMMLVVDITKGMQTQTAECLVIGEITCDKMIVVLNKVDLVAVDKRASTIDRVFEHFPLLASLSKFLNYQMTKRMLKTLENTRFAGSPVIPVAAKPGEQEGGETESAIGINELIDALSTYCYWPNRDAKGPFIFSVDHCFSIKGHGTVMTGTVLSGTVSVNDTIEIPALKVTKKVKSMQMFKKPVESAVQGDRVGICVTQFEAKQLERGLVCKPDALPSVSAGILRVSKISYFKGTVMTKAKFHITIGHDTLMGRVSFFGLDGQTTVGQSTDVSSSFDFKSEYFYQDELMMSVEDHNSVSQFALVEFERPVTCGKNFLVIGSKLDTDIHANMCRIAFHGRLIESFTDANYVDTVLPLLKVFKNRCKEGIVERRVDEYTVICRGLFKKESKVDPFIGLKVTLSTGELGIIEGGFGQSGKFKVRIPAGLGENATLILDGKANKKGKSNVSSGDAAADTSSAIDHQSIKVVLHFKRFIYDAKKKMIQS